jgi:hypothetical protein
MVANAEGYRDLKPPRKRRRNVVAEVLEATVM